MIGATAKRKSEKFFTLPGRPFEFVLFDAPELQVPADAEAFVEYCTGTAADEGVVGFSNLGKDAYLLAPCQSGSLAAYAHLAAFTREAPDWQNHALWIMVGQALERHVTDRPLWLNTAGMGISWLHVRLDSRPKYYGFAPYRTFP